jgi:hypothetical protein
MLNKTNQVGRTSRYKKANVFSFSNGFGILMRHGSILADRV